MHTHANVCCARMHKGHAVKRKSTEKEGARIGREAGPDRMTKTKNSLQLGTVPLFLIYYSHIRKTICLRNIISRHLAVKMSKYKRHIPPPTHTLCFFLFVSSFLNTIVIEMVDRVQ